MLVLLFLILIAGLLGGTSAALWTAFIIAIVLVLNRAYQKFYNTNPKVVRAAIEKALAKAEKDKQ